MDAKDQQATGAATAAEAKTENVYNDVFQFYVNQFEQFVPIARQAVEDWYTLYEKIWDNTFKLQEEFYRQWTNKGEDTSDVTEQGRSFAQKIINTQKEIAVTAIDMAARNVQSLKRPADKQA